MPQGQSLCEEPVMGQCLLWFARRANRRIPERQRKKEHATLPLVSIKISMELNRIVAHGPVNQLERNNAMARTDTTPWKLISPKTRKSRDRIFLTLSSYHQIAGL